METCCDATLKTQLRFCQAIKYDFFSPQLIVARQSLCYAWAAHRQAAQVDFFIQHNSASATSQVLCPKENNQ